MKVDYLLVGQGICGSFLAYELQRANKTIVVYDESRQGTASQVASGIINPVTGRRIVTTWMIDELMPYAEKFYRRLEQELGISCFTVLPTLDFFPTPQMRLAFLKRLDDNDEYLSLPADENKWLSALNYAFGFGSIAPCFLVDLSRILGLLRERLVKKQTLRTECFHAEDLKILDDHIRYHDIEAEKIIFCDGVAGHQNPWFKNLPFAPNKGEALIVEIKDLPRDHIYKKGISLVPWKEDLWWVGSSHEWQFDETSPTEKFYHATITQLKSFCRLPFSVQDHLAAIRPATLERRPFVGFHPAHSSVGIFNGMGTKGCSLAPFFAVQLVDHIVNQKALMPEVDILRYKNVLSRN